MSASAEAPLGWLVQGKSWPSLHRLGVMNENARRLAHERGQVRGEAGLAAQRRRAASRPVGEPERDDVLVAVGLVVDHRVEVDERVVARGVAVARLGFLRFVGRVRPPGARRRRPRGWGRCPCPPVGLPGELARRRQLGADVGHFGRVHAADRRSRRRRESSRAPVKSSNIGQSAWFCGFGGWPETSET